MTAPSFWLERMTNGGLYGLVSSITATTAKGAGVGWFGGLSVNAAGVDNYPYASERFFVRFLLGGADEVHLAESTGSNTLVGQVLSEIGTLGAEKWYEFAFIAQEGHTYDVHTTGANTVLGAFVHRAGGYSG